MAIPCLLNMAAVPIVNSNSLASRRAQRSNRQPQNQEPAQIQPPTLTPHQAALIRALAVEAAQVLQSTSASTNTTASVSINTDLTVPPNSPSYSAPTSSNFEFPEVENQDAATVTTSSSSEDEAVQANKVGFRRTRSQRKRRRVPSFKGLNRVPPKYKIAVNSEDADDEDSCFTDTDEVMELKLKLEVLSQTAAASEADSSEEVDCCSSSCESDDDKWFRVGEELRTIADTFAYGLDEDDATSVASTRGGTFDLLTFINLMLPVSVPRSLWSALVSYAAWKIFKRFGEN